MKFTPGDDLLECISCSGLLTWDQFSSYVSEILGDEANPHFIRRDLSRLGFIECFPSEYHAISAAPSVLVETPRIAAKGSTVQCVWAGKRIKSDLSFISEKCTGLGIKIEFLHRGMGPGSIILSGSNVGVFEQLALECGSAFGGLVCERLLLAAPMAFLSSAARANLVELSEEKLEWLDLARLEFGPTRTTDISACRVRRRFSEAYYFVNGDDAWPLLKSQAVHLACRQNGIEVLIYLPDKNMVRVRGNTPLPEMLERGLVLCSGTTPNFDAGWLFYSNVPRYYYETVTSKLGRHFEG